MHNMTVDKCFDILFASIAGGGEFDHGDESKKVKQYSSTVRSEVHQKVPRVSGTHSSLRTSCTVRICLVVYLHTGTRYLVGLQYWYW